MKFDIVQHLTVARFWNNVEAGNEEQAIHSTVHSDIPPDNEEIIESEIDTDETKEEK